MKDRERVAENLSKAGFSVGGVSALYCKGRTIWIVDAHGYGKRFIVCANEMLTAFLKLQRGDTRVRGVFDLVNHFPVAVVEKSKRAPTKNCVDSVPASFAISDTR